MSQTGVSRALEFDVFQKALTRLFVGIIKTGRTVDDIV